MNMTAIKPLRPLSAHLGSGLPGAAPPAERRPSVIFATQSGGGRPPPPGRAVTQEQGQHAQGRKIHRSIWRPRAGALGREHGRGAWWERVGVPAAAGRRIRWWATRSASGGPERGAPAPARTWPPPALSVVPK